MIICFGNHDIVVQQDTKTMPTSHTHICLLDTPLVSLFRLYHITIRAVNCAVQ